jgi:23S rRNA pseudouridine1911/1915/1917 synthase
MTLQVLYEDNHIIAAVKPHNMPSMPDASGDPDMLSTVKAYVKEKYNKPGEAYIGLVHRLDRPTGGVMVFARTSKAAARLCKQFAEKTTRKEYLAVVRGSLPEKTGTLVSRLIKDEEENMVREAEDGEGKEARLDYTVLKERDGMSLLKVLLHTGRGHQIRVQLASIGHPVAGDMKYGKDEKKGLLGLWAHTLEIEHPVRKERMAFTAPPPEGGVWAGMG